MATDADWFRWVGVVVALAGVLIAAPDAVVADWRQVRARTGKLRAAVAGHVPWRKHGHPIHGAGGMMLAKTRFEATGRVWRDWDHNADDVGKIAILHRQVDLLAAEVQSLSATTHKDITELRIELQLAVAQLRAADDDMATSLARREKRTVQVDARGLLPVGLGILLTGIPGELADVPVLGWLITVTAIAITSWRLIQVAADYRESAPEAAPEPSHKPA